MRRTVQNESVVWRDQAESDVSGSHRNRSQVCPVGHKQMRKQSEGIALAVPVPRESVCGKTGIDPGDVSQGTSRDHDSGPQSQGQGHGQEADRSGERWSLVGVRSGEAVERGAGRELPHPSRTECPKGSHLPYGELAEPDCPAVAASHPDDGTEFAKSEPLSEGTIGAEMISHV